MASGAFKIGFPDVRHRAVNARVIVPGEPRRPVPAFPQLLAALRLWGAPGLGFPSRLAIEGEFESAARSEVVNRAHLVEPGVETFKLTPGASSDIHSALAVDGLNARSGSPPATGVQGPAQYLVCLDRHFLRCQSLAGFFERRPDLTGRQAARAQRDEAAKRKEMERVLHANCLEKIKARQTERHKLLAQANCKVSPLHYFAADRSRAKIVLASAKLSFDPMSNQMPGTRQV